MTDPRDAALRQALEALQLIDDHVLMRDHEQHECTAAIAAARAALVTKVEPVAWARQTDEMLLPADAISWVKTALHTLPLYAAPQPQREPLTDAQIIDLCQMRGIVSGAVEFARAIERAHGIG